MIKVLSTLFFSSLLFSCQTTAKKEDKKKEGIIRFIFTDKSEKKDFSLMQQLAFEKISKICKNQAFKVDDTIPLYLGKYISYHDSINLQVEKGKIVETKFTSSYDILTKKEDMKEVHLDFLIYFACSE